MAMSFHKAPPSSPVQAHQATLSRWFGLVGWLVGWFAVMDSLWAQAKAATATKGQQVWIWI